MVKSPETRSGRIDYKIKINSAPLFKIVKITQICHWGLLLLVIISKFAGLKIIGLKYEILKYSSFRKIVL